MSLVLKKILKSVVSLRMVSRPFKMLLLLIASEAFLSSSFLPAGHLVSVPIHINT